MLGWGVGIKEKRTQAESNSDALHQPNPKIKQTKIKNNQKTQTEPKLMD